MIDFLSKLMKYIRRINYFLLIILIVLIVMFIGLRALFLWSWSHEKDFTPPERSDYFFRISETDINIITSKRKDAQFYVMFSNKDTIAPQSDNNIDYIKFETAEMGPVNIILDSQNKNDIYIKDSEYLKDVNPVRYNIKVLDDAKFDSLFFEPRIRTNPLILKYPFIHIGMASNTYTIWMDKYKSVQKTIKEGNIYGGW